MLKEFKEFAMKGNMLDLAIGFILGAAFSTIVTSLVADIILPIIAAIFGNVDFSNLYVQMTGDNPGSTLEAAREAGVVLAYGNFITAFINFILVAFALFIVVKAINKMKREQDEAPAEPEAPPQQEVLLGEIRDLLKK